MGRKQSIDEKLLAEKILEFEYSSTDKGNLRWDSISGEVFPKKKKTAIYWWSAGVAAALTAVVLFWVPSGPNQLASEIQTIQPAEQTPDEKNSSSELQVMEPSATLPLPVARVVPSAKAIKTSLEAKNEKEMRKLEADYSPSLPGVSSVEMQVADVAAPKVETLKEFVSEESRDESEKMQVALQTALEKDVLTGKKVVLLVDTTPLESTNEKKGFLKRIGNFNRSGKWEKNEKEAETWARFIESTRPEKRTTQL